MAAQAPETGPTNTVWPGVFALDSRGCSAATVDIVGSRSLGRWEFSGQIGDLAEDAAVKEHVALDLFLDKSCLRTWGQKISARSATTVPRFKPWNDVPLEGHFIFKDRYTIFWALSGAVADTR